MTSQSRRLNPSPCRISGLSDDVVIALLVRAPFFSHGAIRAVSPRLNRVLKSPAFIEARGKHAEHGVIVVSKQGKEGWLLAAGQWRPIAPCTADMFAQRDGPAPHAPPLSCSTIFGGEMCIFGCVDNKYGPPQGAVRTYNAQTNSWRHSLTNYHINQGSVAAVFGGSLVIAGGEFDGGGGPDDGPCGGVTAYKTIDGSGIVHLPCMEVEASDAIGACVMEGKLFVVGGEGGECAAEEGYDGTQFQMFDGKEWAFKADLPIPLMHAACAVHDGKLMVIGGTKMLLTRRSCCVTKECINYDLKTNTWEQGVSLPAPRTGCRATTHAGIITLIGGGPPLQFRDEEWFELSAQTPTSIVNLRHPTVETILLG